MTVEVIVDPISGLTSYQIIVKPSDQDEYVYEHDRDLDDEDDEDEEEDEDDEDDEEDEQDEEDEEDDN